MLAFLNHSTFGRVIPSHTYPKDQKYQKLISARGRRVNLWSLCKEMGFILLISYAFLFFLNLKIKRKVPSIISQEKLKQNEIWFLELEPDLKLDFLKINLFSEKSLEPGVSWRLIRSSPLVPDWVTHDWNGTELGRFQIQNHSLIFFQERDPGLHIFVEVEVQSF